MFLKSLTIIVFAAALGVVLLDFRQQRLETMNEMARLHGKIDQARQSMWTLQVRIADHIEPPALLKAIERARLKLEPTTPTPAPLVASSEPAHTPAPGTLSLPRRAGGIAGNTQGTDQTQNANPVDPRQVAAAD